VVQPQQGLVYFEAVVRPDAQSLFAPDAIVSADNVQQFAAPQARREQAARVLQQLGLQVQQIGSFSISGNCPAELWQQVFGTRVEQRTQLLSTAHPDAGSITFWSHMPNVPFTIPDPLSGLVERAYPQLPPLLFESPLPPAVDYFHLGVPDDVATILRSNRVHKRGVTGRGVLVAMPDTGFYRHPFYDWHGYNYQATLAPDAIDVDRDDFGHGTAEAANIFANAPDIDFVGVKMGGNPTLAFKAASDLYPAVMTNSWGYDLCGVSVLPNFLRPLEAAVVEAVHTRGITVCFSAGNGHTGFPGMMPDVISAGGVNTDGSLSGSDFQLQASDYASSFDSAIYPGRHVPDVCGLVGMMPRGIYIMLPLQPGCTIDASLAGGTFPNLDQTAPDDGWAVISGTSAASPQVAGVCALLKQVQPGLAPSLIQSILKASARAVTAGQSNVVCGTAVPARPTPDGACGNGLVDAFAAYQLARSVSQRNLFTIPPPR